MNKKEKEARKLLHAGNFKDAVDKLNEAGLELHRAGDSDKAIEVLEEGSKIALQYGKLQYERSFCERALSEIHADLGNKEQCLRHIQKFRTLSKECKDKSQEQLSYHVEAWCLQQLFLNGKAERTDLEEAIKKTKESRNFVKKHEKEFKPDGVGGPPHKRKADLYTLEAQLQHQLGNTKEAMNLLAKTAQCLKSNDKSTKFEMLRTKCSVAPVSQRIDIAELMDDDAPEEKKAQALTELSHQYVLGKMLERGYKALAHALIMHQKQFGRDDLQDSVKRLCILYRLVKYSEILKSNKKSKQYSLCQLHEAIGDLYDKYYQTLLETEKKEYRQFLKENILQNYEKMLEFKRNDEDVLRANLAIALVYWDLEEYSKSRKIFEQRLELLEKIGASEDKILDTRVSIFNCKTKINFPGLEREFDVLKNAVEPFNNTKRELYEVWANYWSDKNDEEQATIWRDAAETVPEVLIRNQDDETDFLFFEYSDDDILEKCRDENELLKLDRLTDYQLTKTNSKGETLLHLAAMKSDNHRVVGKLCSLGSKVDAKDNGGWTPLMEAVANNQCGNVKVLIRFGADVNAKSIQSFECDSPEEINHGNLTPLMDACTNGYIEIAQILIDNKARVDLRDKSGWTAYHHLKQHIEDKEVTDEETLKFAEYLRTVTQNYGPLVDIPVCNIKTSANRLNQESDDSPPDDVEDGIILGMAASRKRKFSSEYENSRNLNKRKQRSGENMRMSPPLVHIPQKRNIQPSSSYVQPRKIYRQTSSSSLTSNPRYSMSPRRSMSPSGTIRSAPSVYAGDDDIQVVGVRRSFDRPQVQIAPKLPSPAFVHQRFVPSPRQQFDLNSSEIVVKCCFQLPAGSGDEIRPEKLPMKRTMSISEVKTTVISRIPAISQFKIKAVWNKDDEDKCGVDELTLTQVADKPNQREVALVFDLGAP
ncbi:hypothetical protein CRE_29694 [Caenorhabditis remanei]|uniref:Uncharacterized protein n=1 Tax=Caenorhabditis remanei TaxID=31234 RepID=E3LV85_CAERE|nr:hypothetical protein CRE_29694 [Caenorhabditis remanei]